MTYVPPPPSEPQPSFPPPQPVVPVGQKDRTELFGWLGIIIGLLCCAIAGIILGVLSIRDAKKFGKSPVLGYVAIAASIVNLIGGAIWATMR